jgi:hypothetical protein
MTRTLRIALAALLTAGVACQESVAPDPIVQFRMESQTCGGPISFQFSIDQVPVGTESLRDRQTSAAYPTAAGQHAFRVAWVGGSFVHDELATVRAGETFTVIVNPYCS